MFLYSCRANANSAKDALSTVVYPYKVKSNPLLSGIFTLHIPRHYGCWLIEGCTTEGGDQQTADVVMFLSQQGPKQNNMKCKLQNVSGRPGVSIMKLDGAVRGTMTCYPSEAAL